MKKILSKMSEAAAGFTTFFTLSAKHVSAISKAKGFTLIELLVVIAIIGILSSVVLASLSTARAKSRDAKRISDLGQIQLALELYFDSNATYPTSSKATAFTAGKTGDGSISSNLASLTSANYIPKLPVDPSGNSTYWYGALASPSATAFSTTGSVTNYILAALLERADNNALDTDADKDVGTIFHGGNSDCLSTANGAAGTEKCYDIIN